MAKIGRALASALLCCLMLLGTAVPVLAAEADVRYEGGAEGFVFLPGEDLFPNFKGVMPGDTLEQTVTIRNALSGNGTVKLYLRGESAGRNDEEAEDFLGRMTLKIYHGDLLIAQGKADAVQPEESVLLGRFPSGGSTELKVVLEVPAELGNDFADRAGEVVWVFTAEEIPPAVGPQTGDKTPVVLLVTLLLASLLGMAVLLMRRKPQSK